MVRKLTESEILVVLMITGTRSEVQSFRRKVDTGSSSHCLLGREFKQTAISIRTSVMSQSIQIGYFGKSVGCMGTCLLPGSHAPLGKRACGPRFASRR